MKLRVLLIAFVLIHWVEEVSSGEFHNLTREWIQEEQRNRQKRFILFDNGGICKLVIGVVSPLLLGDKKPWRSLNFAYNFQAQYAVPPKPIYWWDRWDGRSLLDAKLQYKKDGTYVPDESRRFMYAVLELYADRAGKNGKKCLLRAICEHAAVKNVEGVFFEILRAILTPGDDADEEYKDAYGAGKFGAVCTSLYPECPQGKGIFDSLFYTQATDDDLVNT